MGPEENHTEVAVLTERIKAMQKTIDKLDAKTEEAARRTTAMLISIVVACVLLVINAIIERI